MNLKYAFSGLSRKPLFAVLTVLQLIASVLLLYSSISYENYFESKAKMMIQVFKNKSLYAMNFYYAPDLEKIPKTDLEQFYKFINTSRNFTYTSVDDDSFYINTSKQNNDFVKAYAPKSINDENYELVYQLIVDNNFFSKFNFKLAQGKEFEKKDFDVKYNDPIPVILGDSYSNVYKVGDKIKYLDYDNKPKELLVKGFLQKEYYFADNTGVENMNNLDKYIIFPRQPIALNSYATSEYSEEFYKIDLLNSSFRGYIDISNKNSNSITKEIISEGKKCGFDFKVISLDESISNFIKTNNNLIFCMRALFIIVFIFTAVGIITSLNYSILRKYKEFGVHIMQGASLWNIAVRIFYEILLLFIIADTSLFAILHTILKGDVILCFNAINFLITVIISIILTMILSIMPVMKVLNLQVSDLIRGDE